jgi:hypothetical protein
MPERETRALAVQTGSNVDAYRASTDAAAICRDMVIASATTIQGRKFVGVEGWMAVAIAHGCVASARDVEKVEGGVRAIGEIRRMSDGKVIAEAEGFVGEDEETWYGGTNKYGKVLPKRNDYAIRAMAQTRAISRACRSAFAHVIVMMNAGLSTTPAEEVPHGGFDDRQDAPQADQERPRHPAPRTVLDGPYKSANAIMQGLKRFQIAMNACTDEAGLDALLDQAAPLIEQAKRDTADYWEGDGGDDVGFQARIDAKRASFAPSAVGVLIESLDSCETKIDLQNWLAEHGDTVDGLTDEERRKFEAEYERIESRIDTLNAHVS